MGRGGGEGSRGRRGAGSRNDSRWGRNHTGGDESTHAGNQAIGLYRRCPGGGSAGRRSSQGGLRMSRKKKHPEHVNHERWLISYADFITLLFAFFVVLYSSSQVDHRKVGKLALAI